MPGTKTTTDKKGKGKSEKKMPPTVTQQRSLEQGSAVPPVSTHTGETQTGVSRVGKHTKRTQTRPFTKVKATQTKRKLQGDKECQVEGPEEKRIRTPDTEDKNTQTDQERSELTRVIRETTRLLQKTTIEIIQILTSQLGNKATASDIISDILQNIQTEQQEVRTDTGTEEEEMDTEEEKEEEVIPSEKSESSESSEEETESSESEDIEEKEEGLEIIEEEETVVSEHPVETIPEKEAPTERGIDEISVEDISELEGAPKEPPKMYYLNIATSLPNRIKARQEREKLMIYISSEESELDEEFNFKWEQHYDKPRRKGYYVPRSSLSAQQITEIEQRRAARPAQTPQPGRLTTPVFRLASPSEISSEGERLEAEEEEEERKEQERRGQLRESFIATAEKARERQNRNNALTPAPTVTPVITARPPSPKPGPSRVPIQAPSPKPGPSRSPQEGRRTPIWPGRPQQGPFPTKKTEKHHSSLPEVRLRKKKRSRRSVEDFPVYRYDRLPSGEIGRVEQPPSELTLEPPPGFARVAPLAPLARIPPLQSLPTPPGFSPIRESSPERPPTRRIVGPGGYEQIIEALPILTPEEENFASLPRFDEISLQTRHELNARATCSAKLISQILHLLRDPNYDDKLELRDTIERRLGSSFALVGSVALKVAMRGSDLNLAYNSREMRPTDLLNRLSDRGLHPEAIPDRYDPRNEKIRVQIGQTSVLFEGRWGPEEQFKEEVLGRSIYQRGLDEISLLIHFICGQQNITNYGFLTDGQGRYKNNMSATALSVLIRCYFSDHPGEVTRIASECDRVLARFFEWFARIAELRDIEGVPQRSIHTQSGLRLTTGSHVLYIEDPVTHVNMVRNIDISRAGGAWETIKEKKLWPLSGHSFQQMMRFAMVENFRRRFDLY